MTTRTTPPKGARPAPVVHNADIPSETAGLPGVGEGASARHFARDMAGRPPGTADEAGGSGGTPGPHAPADPRDEPD